MKENVVIATIKSWNVRNAKKLKEDLQGKYDVWIITEKENLTYETLDKIKPTFVFFPHWSWKIPREIHENFNCVGFHMTDLPYGRGGSPLQNLILNKVYETVITAFRITEELDAGEIYMKVPFYIGVGSAEEIYMKASEIIFTKMIPYILENRPAPTKQSGEVVVFKRRTPNQSDIMKADIQSLDDIYDFIRMLDAEDYPKAFIQIGKMKILFSEVHRKNEKLVGRFEIIEEK
jgi:methionyl-tRNA formyltransferase